MLLKKRSELDPEQEAKLSTILATSGELRALYLLREEFRIICDKIDDRVRSERVLLAWIWKAMLTGSRYLSCFVKTFRNW